MNFLQSLQDDLNTFINPNEFAQPIQLNETTLPAIVNHHSGNLNITEKMSNHIANNNFRTQLHAPELYGDFVEIFFKADDFPLPHFGEFLRLNAVRYKVDFAASHNGISHIILVTDRSPRNTLPRLKSLYEGD